MPSHRGRPFPTTQPLGRIAYARGFTLSELANLSGVYVRTLTEYVAGRKPIQPHHLLPLAKALGVSEKELLG